MTRLVLTVIPCFLLALETRAFVSVTPGCRHSAVVRLFDEASDDDTTAPSRQQEQPADDLAQALDIKLQPFLPAADSNYRSVGPVGDGSFLVTREGEPLSQELTSDNILKIVVGDCTDLEVNTLVWKGLGYRFVNGQWNNEQVFPKWREKYPDPPDLIGMQRIYSKQVDEPSMRANQQLVRSIPVEHKQQLRTHLKPMGFMGFKIAELTPNKTRRAQCANWLLYYRDHLFGYTLDELRAQRATSNKAPSTSEQQEEDWRPPIKEVF